jgi:hypothetical protein
VPKKQCSVREKRDAKASVAPPSIAICNFAKATERIGGCWWDNPSCCFTHNTHTHTHTLDWCCFFLCQSLLVVKRWSSSSTAARMSRKSIDLFPRASILAGTERPGSCCIAQCKKHCIFLFSTPLHTARAEPPPHLSLSSLSGVCAGGPAFLRAGHSTLPPIFEPVDQIFGPFNGVPSISTNVLFKKS